MRKKRQWNSYREPRIIPNSVAWGVWIVCVFIFLAVVIFPKLHLKEIPKETLKETGMRKCEVVIDGTDWHSAVSHIKQTESFQPNQYQLGNYWYIGYGHQTKSGECWEQISESQATEILENDLLRMINYVSSRYDVTGNQSLALGMLFYNVRHSSIYSSVMDAELKKGPFYWDEEKIQESWAKLCRFGGKEHAGLRERREFEIRLFFGYGK